MSIKTFNSTCCNATITVDGDDQEGTHYYVCNKCNKPCDIAVAVTKTNEDNLRQQLAAIEHERWADWQNWVHKVYLEGDFGEAMLRWQKQIATPYAALLDKEQLSDMEQVDRYWPLIQDYINQNYRPITAIKEAIGPDESYTPNWSGGRTNLLRHEIKVALQLDEGDVK